MGRIRVGVVGIGNNGIHHAKAYFHSPKARLAALCDYFPEKMQHAKDWIGFGDDVGVYTDVDTMLAKADLDAVSVNSCDHLHAEPFVKALAAGCHVIVEKPKAPSAPAR